MTKLAEYLYQFGNSFSFFNVGSTKVFIYAISLLVMIGIYKFVKDLLPW